ncbi:hypothetical protein BUALT_Bualt06G0132200 [Buddleja alternifolia]|uniref:8-amino-7-oxononanoate synthase n=1 Tax=Buddleja alternifolia TaxID=168488 RepID=A0AAV6XEV6_9LAMI|nr:hypothetical protein BUALT_Bualt06G0132200 [Buddleja alternifolia]
MEVNCCVWDDWVEIALSKLESLKVLRSLRPIHLPNTHHKSSSGENNSSNRNREFQIFDGPGKWDRDSVEVSISESTFQKWLHDVPSSGDDNDAILENGVADGEAEQSDGKLRKLIVFSGNDYLGLSSHPAVSNAASKACYLGCSLC